MKSVARHVLEKKKKKTTQHLKDLKIYPSLGTQDFRRINSISENNTWD
jgi:hypothetical protein